MGSAPSSNRVSAVSLQNEQELNCKECEKLKDFEIRASELEKALEISQQRCLEVEAQHSQASDELGMLREELERLNKQLADSRVSSASERATKQVHINYYRWCWGLIILWLFLATSQLVRRLESDLSTAKQDLIDMVRNLFSSYCIFVKLSKFAERASWTAAAKSTCFVSKIPGWVGSDCVWIERGKPQTG